jgi:hypothetical protein
MNQCAPGTGESAAFQTASLELRAAQRAFAASLESARNAGEFRGAQLRGAARRTLSALSADDRARLSDWLSLLFATGDPHLADAAIGDTVLRSLARIDAALAARVRRMLPQRVEALASHGGASRIVAA